MNTTTKNKYEEEDDAIILDALDQSPGNISEALRIASEELKSRRGIEATPEQLSSRYYSYIVPHYIKGNDPRPVPDNAKHAVASAGSFKAAAAGRPQMVNSKLDLLIEMVDKVGYADQKGLFDYLFHKL